MLAVVGVIDDSKLIEFLGKINFKLEKHWLCGAAVLPLHYNDSPQCIFFLYDTIRPARHDVVVGGHIV